MMGHSNDKRVGLPANGAVDVRGSRGVRLIGHAGTVRAYAEPHRTPVLPAGWAPLTREQQDAVLQACNVATQAMVFRIGSLWDAGAEYRVYRLAAETWAGLWVATRYVSGASDRGGIAGGNWHLLGLGTDAAHVVQLAVDFFNWDLEAHGEQWRLSATPPPAADADPRR